MCTAFTLNTDGFYFGRTLDNFDSFGEAVAIMPRNFPIALRSGKTMVKHFSVIGMAHIADGIPLYYDAMNEAGLCAAALRFPSAHYEHICGEASLAHFEVISVVLAECGSAADAIEFLSKTGISDEAFSPDYPLSPLHWIFADRTRAFVAEPDIAGLRIYEDPAGVLTNEPRFDVQMKLLSDYMGLSPNQPSNRFAKELQLQPYSFGAGAIGLPGDNSSRSRFVRCSFNKFNAVSLGGGTVSDFFRIASSVAQINVTSVSEDGASERTIYTSCCDVAREIYYYSTYENRRICGIKLDSVKLDGSELICYPCATEEDILFMT